MRRASVLLSGAALLLAGTVVSGQAPGGQGAGRGPAPTPQNLQILPKDTTFQQVIGVMQQFNTALGVTCVHCHQFVGPNDPGNDFASDAKPAKNVARRMMEMLRGINPTVQRAVAPKAADQVVGVNCMMCHRGSAIPQLPPPPARGAGPGGPAPK